MKLEKSIGVIGLGSVGSALKHVLDYFFPRVEGYDINGEYDWSKVLSCDLVFICVPTPEGSDGRLDCTQVDATLIKLQRDGYTGIIVIKSTIRVGFMEEAILRYPDLRLVYSPEFMREKSRLQWTTNPDRIVLAGDAGDVEEVKTLIAWAEEAKIIVTDYRSAEIGKLAHNAYIALKVSFTNEIEEICRELHANPEDVMDIVSSDRRVISKEHLRPGLGPYAGKCVPKDTRELINASTSSELLRSVEDVNNKKMKQNNIVENTTFEYTHTQRVTEKEGNNTRKNYSR